MTLRVVQWATGGVGRAAIEGILLHPELELVGCFVHSEAKDGVDVGELIGAEPLGVLATSSKERILELEADCVLYAPLMADVEDVTALLRSGKNVVTPVAWIYPSERQQARLDEACQEGGTTLHGTGVNPGGIPDLHPLMFSALTSGVTFVRGEEFSDIRSYDAPDVVRHVMGFGGTPEETRSGPMLGLLSAGFERSVRMCLDVLGFSPEAEIRADLELAVATAPIDSPIGVIEPGRVAGQRFVWEAVVRDQVVVRVAVNWLMGEEHLEPAWHFGPRRGTVRGRGPGRPEHVRHDQGVATGHRGRWPGAEPRHRGHGHALRELDPCGVRGRVRGQDVRRPSARDGKSTPRPRLNTLNEAGPCATIPPS